MSAELEAAVAFAELERDEALRAFRRTLHEWTRADLRLLSARLDLADALAEPGILLTATDFERKA